MGVFRDGVLDFERWHVECQDGDGRSRTDIFVVVMRRNIRPLLRDTLSVPERNFNEVSLDSILLVLTTELLQLQFLFQLLLPSILACVLDGVFTLFTYVHDSNCHANVRIQRLTHPE